MNAIDLLKEDHRIVDGLFKQVESTPPSKHVALFKRIKGELDTHAHVEEVIFYPALKKGGDKEAKDMVLEGFEEHHHMKISLAEIAALTPKKETFEPKLKVMIEMTRHHVKEEEGIGGMFSMAEEHLGTPALEKLGDKMQAEKDRFMKANGIKPEPRPALTTLGALVEKAKEVVTGAFGGNATPAAKSKSRSTTANANNTKTKSVSKAKSSAESPKKNASAKSARAGSR